MLKNHSTLANALRILSIDAIQKANSGHPGMPMGMADILTVLWREYLHHNPLNPDWPNRDRFILSNGHGSMLQYAALHLSGYALSLEDLKQFRQLHSKTPGHPEWKITSGIETSTGPLGQGLANAVGMALAEKTLAAQFNRANHTIVDHYTYVFLGDGCLMEGVSHEVSSLAGTLKLGKLIAFWDNNGISIEGQVDPWFNENVPQRFNAYDWHVIPDIDGHDPKQISKAIQVAQRVTDRPSLLCCKTQIGFGSPNLVGSHKAHGAPLSASEIEATRAHLNWQHPPFIIPDDIYHAWNACDQGQALEAEWRQRFENYRAEHPKLAEEFNRRIQGKLPSDWENQSAQMIKAQLSQNTALATRKSSQLALNYLGPILPELLGGSADLSESNATLWKGCNPLNTQADGNYLQYGVREFGMAAIMNGLALHGGFIPYGGTFLVFSDYARPAIRLAALMKLRVIFVLTHDSIGVGEDGPTHQPIEQLSSLRLIPNLTLWRPCDSVETAMAWQQAIQHVTGPSAIVLTRQNVPPQIHELCTLADIANGGYTLLECTGTPEVILIATGSEVNTAMMAAKHCTSKFNMAIRVVSIPSREQFSAQSAVYQEKVLPKTVTKRIVIEAGTTSIWHREAGPEGLILGIDQYGESAPGPEVFSKFKLTQEAIVDAIRSIV